MSIDKSILKTVSLIGIFCSLLIVMGMMQVDAAYVPPHSATINTNSEFDVDLTAWTFQSQPGFTMTPEVVTDIETWGGNGRVLKVTSTIDYVGYWRNRFYQNIPVAAGITYTVRIRAKADAARAAGIILQNTNGSIKYIDTYAGINGTDMTLTTTPMEYTYTFTPTVSEVLVLYVNIGQSDTTVYFDYIRCTMDIPGTDNIVVDGTFDEPDTVGTNKAINNWVLETKNGANATVSIVQDEMMGSNVLKLTPGSIIGVVDDVQLNQFKIPFQANEVYYVQFDARADANRTIKVLLQQESSPWATYNVQSEIPVNSFKNTYTFRFQPTEGSVPGNRIALKFCLGGSSSAVYIDNVRVLAPLNPFVLEFSSHSDNDTNVDVDKPISFRFSNPLNPDCLNSNHVLLSGGTTVVSSISLSPDGKSFTVHTSERLSFNTFYIIRLIGIKDIYEQTLEDIQISFQTVKEFEFGNSVFRKVNEDFSEIEITNFTTGTIKYVTNVTNRGDLQKEAVLIMALYNKYDSDDSIELVDAQSKAVLIGKETIPVEVEIFVQPSSQKQFIKVYMWENFEEMKPFMEEVILE